jgi:hypothetical protein
MRVYTCTFDGGLVRCFERLREYEDVKPAKPPAVGVMASNRNRCRDTHRFLRRRRARGGSSYCDTAAAHCCGRGTDCVGHPARADCDASGDGGAEPHSYRRAKPDISPEEADR